MDIEKLREAVGNIRFILSANPDWREGRLCGLSDDETEEKANKSMSFILENIDELMVNYIIDKRHSVTDEAIKEAIEWAKEERDYYLRHLIFDNVDHAQLAITALQQMRTEPCCVCSGLNEPTGNTTFNGYRLSHTYFCPRCGRSLKGE